jgi:CubicO group peptidase (beta-lactamase class C family)
MRRFTFPLAVALAACSTPDLTTPPQLDDGWRVGDAAEAGFDTFALERLATDVRDGQFPNTHALLIEHDGTLVFEQYFEGSDERWGDPLGHRVVGRDSLHDVRSISKTATSILLGIALGDGFGEAVNRPVTSWFPDQAPDEAHRAITLHHVLTMTAGLDWCPIRTPATTRSGSTRRWTRPRRSWPGRW